MITITGPDPFCFVDFPKEEASTDEDTECTDSEPDDSNVSKEELEAGLNDNAKKRKAAALVAAGKKVSMLF